MTHIVENRKAKFHYEVIETFEVGIVLTGTEVKSIRQKKVSLDESYIVIQKQQLFLMQSHIEEYSQGNQFNHDPVRKRKLLAHHHQIIQLLTQTSQKNLTLIPLKIYLKGSWIKILIGLVRGKTHADKRQQKKQDDAKREMACQIKNIHIK